MTFFAFLFITILCSIIKCLFAVLKSFLIGSGETKNEVEREAHVTMRQEAMRRHKAQKERMVESSSSPTTLETPKHQLSELEGPTGWMLGKFFKK